jgi:hypothetical protein
VQIGSSPSARRPLVAALTLLALGAPPAVAGCDPIVTIRNPDSLPALTQRHDFTQTFQFTDTDILDSHGGQSMHPPRRRFFP